MFCNLFTITCVSGCVHDFAFDEYKQTCFVTVGVYWRLSCGWRFAWCRKVCVQFKVKMCSAKRRFLKPVFPKPVRRTAMVVLLRVSRHTEVECCTFLCRLRKHRFVRHSRKNAICCLPEWKQLYSIVTSPRVFWNLCVKVHGYKYVTLSIVLRRRSQVVVLVPLRNRCEEKCRNCLQPAVLFSNISCRMMCVMVCAYVWVFYQLHAYWVNTAATLMIKCYRSHLASNTNNRWRLTSHSVVVYAFVRWVVCHSYKYIDNGLLFRKN